VSLTTVLAHSSGNGSLPTGRCARGPRWRRRAEWARRFARRHALFTGQIAGEDDLDAPDPPNGRRRAGGGERHWRPKRQWSGAARTMAFAKNRGRGHRRGTPPEVQRRRDRLTGHSGSLAQDGAPVGANMRLAQNTPEGITRQPWRRRSRHARSQVAPAPKPAASAVPSSHCRLHAKLISGAAREARQGRASLPLASRSRRRKARPQRLAAVRLCPNCSR
jgi:hypothetical protein